MVGRSGRYNESGVADGQGIGLWIVGVRGSNLSAYCWRISMVISNCTYHTCVDRWISSVDHCQNKMLVEP